MTPVSVQRHRNILSYVPHTVNVFGVTARNVSNGHHPLATAFQIGVAGTCTIVAPIVIDLLFLTTTPQVLWLCGVVPRLGSHENTKTARSWLGSSCSKWTPKPCSASHSRYSGRTHPGVWANFLASGATRSAMLIGSVSSAVTVRRSRTYSSRPYKLFIAPSLHVHIRLINVASAVCLVESWQKIGRPVLPAMTAHAVRVAQPSGRFDKSIDDDPRIEC